MKTKQKASVLLILIVTLLSSMFVFFDVKPAAAAFYDKKADCEAAGGIWASACWMNTSDGKIPCQKFGGLWITTDTNIPYEAALALGANPGYCKIDGAITPGECESGLSDALTGECSEDKFCKKYTNTAKRNACKKGYINGSSACAGLDTQQKEACKDGADNGKDFATGTGTTNTGIGRECADQSMLSFRWPDRNGNGCADTADLIALVFQVLAGMVGVVVVGGIAWGGMLYTTSNGNASKAQQGITTIVNSVIGLLLFIFMFAITNFLVPGGILG